MAALAKDMLFNASQNRTDYLATPWNATPWNMLKSWTRKILFVK